MKYAVQIQKYKNGEWTWAGVEAPKDGVSYPSARRAMVRMAKDPFWTERVHVVAFRVRAVPGSGEPKPGPRAQAREALRLAGAAEARCAKLIQERDEARKAAEEYASLQGLGIDW